MKSYHYIHNRIHKQQCEDPNVVWKFPDDVSLSSTSGEVVVGGVYMRLLVSNPTWVLRKPKAFVSDLFDALLDHMTKNTDVSILVQKSSLHTIIAENYMMKNLGKL